jgi:hypothetical protein
MQEIGQAHGYGPYKPEDSFSGGTGDQIIQLLGSIVSGAPEVAALEGEEGPQLAAEAQQALDAIKAAKTEGTSYRTMPDGTKKLVTDQEYADAWKSSPNKLPGGGTSETGAPIGTEVTLSKHDLTLKYSDGTLKTYEVDTSTGGRIPISQRNPNCYSAPLLEVVLKLLLEAAESDYI